MPMIYSIFTAALAGPTEIAASGSIALEVVELVGYINGDKDLLNIEGEAIIRNSSSDDVSLVFRSRVAEIIRIRIVDKSNKTIAKLDCSAYYSDKPEKKLRIPAKEATKERLTMPWPVVEGQNQLRTEAEVIAIVELVQDKVIASCTIKLALKRSKQK